jgi:hypothetical protein
MNVYEQASVALVESLFDDPFYQAISEEFRNDAAARKDALKKYFVYSLDEAERTGRCVMASDPKLGAAAWLLPRSADADRRESAAKLEYLTSVLGNRGAENYERIVGFMAPLARRVVPPGAWYLPIIGVLPSAQSRGMGAGVARRDFERSGARRPDLLSRNFYAAESEVLWAIGISARRKASGIYHCSGVRHHAEGFLTDFSARESNSLEDTELHRGQRAGLYATDDNPEATGCFAPTWFMYSVRVTKR